MHLMSGEKKAFLFSRAQILVLQLQVYHEQDMYFLN